jgi:hypothetical protein
MTRRYAQDTAVPVEKSRAEIERLLREHGATGFMSGWTDDKAHTAFEMHGRRVRFVLRLPRPLDRRFTETKRGPRHKEISHKLWEQACRASWRALLLVIKAKLEAVEAGISVFEDEFLAHIVMPDGHTVAEHIKPAIADAYNSGKMVPLLPNYSKGKPS